MVICGVNGDGLEMLRMKICRRFDRAGKLKCSQQTLVAKPPEDRYLGPEAANC